MRERERERENVGERKISEVKKWETKNQRSKWWEAKKKTSGKFENFEVVRRTYCDENGTYQGQEYE